MSSEIGDNTYLVKIHKDLFDHVNALLAKEHEHRVKCREKAREKRAEVTGKASKRFLVIQDCPKLEIYSVKSK